jgi:hypothetical protein
MEGRGLERLQKINASFDLLEKEGYWYQVPGLQKINSEN